MNLPKQNLSNKTRSVRYSLSPKSSSKIKIAISSTGKNINDNVSSNFGRCPYFIFIEIFEKGQKTKKIETIENENADQRGGVGVTSAQLMAEKNADVIIAGNIGPRALDTLKQFDIEVYLGSGSGEKVLQEFAAGKLEKVEG